MPAPGTPYNPRGYAMDPRNPTGDPLFDTALNLGRNHFWQNTLQQQGMAPLAAPRAPTGMTPFDVRYMHDYGSQAMGYNREKFLQSMNPVAPQLQRMLSQNKATSQYAAAMARHANTPAGMMLTETAMAQPIIQAAMGGDLMGGAQSFMNNAVNFHRMPGAFRTTGDMAKHHGAALSRSRSMAESITQRIYGQNASGERGLVPNQKFLQNFRTEEVFGLANRMAEAGTLTTGSPGASVRSMMEGGMSREAATAKSDEVLTQRVGDMTRAFSHGRNVFGNRSMKELHQMANKMTGKEVTGMDGKQLSRFFDKVAAMAAKTGTHVETLVKGHEMMTKVAQQMSNMEQTVDSTGNMVSVGGRAEAIGMANMETVAGMIAMRRRGGQSVSQHDVQNVIRKTAAITARREGSSMGRSTRLMATAAKAGDIKADAYERYRRAAETDPQLAKQIFIEEFGSVVDDPIKLLNDDRALEEYHKSVDLNFDQRQNVAREVESINIMADSNELNIRASNRVVQQTNRRIGQAAAVSGVSQKDLINKADAKELARAQMSEFITKRKDLDPTTKDELLSNLEFQAGQGDMTAEKLVSRMQKFVSRGDYGVSGSELSRTVVTGMTKERRNRMIDRMGAAGGGGIAEIITAAGEQGVIDNTTLSEARRLMKAGDGAGARKLLNKAAEKAGGGAADTYAAISKNADRNLKERKDKLLETQGLGDKAQGMIGDIEKGRVEGLDLSDDLRKELSGDIKTFTGKDSTREQRATALASIKKKIDESNMSDAAKNKFATKMAGTGMMTDPTFHSEVAGVTETDMIQRQRALKKNQIKLGKVAATTAIDQADELGLSAEQVAGFREAARLSSSHFGSRRDKGVAKMQDLIKGLSPEQRTALDKEVGKKGEEWQGALDVIQTDPGKIADTIGKAADADAAKQTPLQAAVTVLSKKGSIEDVAKMYDMDVGEVKAAVADLKERLPGAGAGGAVRIDTSGKPIPVVIVGADAGGSGGPGLMSRVGSAAHTALIENPRELATSPIASVGAAADLLSVPFRDDLTLGDAAKGYWEASAGGRMVNNAKEIWGELNPSGERMSQSANALASTENQIDSVVKQAKEASAERSPKEGGGGSSAGPQEVTLTNAKLQVEVINQSALSTSDSRMVG